ncbi:MAG: DMT family transporter [Lentisphaeria bacterium]|nr:DMT family transporter [Lentisphaeria bacterium]
MGMGIFFGVLTAVFQTASYFFSRTYLQKSGGAVTLLAASQLVIAFLSLLAAPWVVPPEVLDIKYLPAVLITGWGFLVGHFFFFQALKVIESSRIASLLGLKVVLVPIFLSLIFKEYFSGAQWCALVLAMGAAMLINYRGGALFSWKGMGYFVCALPMYAWSDIGIQMLVRQLPLENNLHAAGIGAIFSNLLVGLTLLPVAWYKRVTVLQFRNSVPYALCWGLGAVMFFFSYSYIGAAFGNVVQATRGPMSLLTGIILARMGWSWLEERVPVRIWVFRAVASLMMFGAIVLYACFKSVS